jgi:hypothetical protein
MRMIFVLSKLFNLSTLLHGLFQLAFVQYFSYLYQRNNTICSNEEEYVGSPHLTDTLYEQSNLLQLFM